MMLRHGQAVAALSSTSAIARGLIIASMSSGEDAQLWLDKGAQAFANLQTAEARQHFQAAVAAAPGAAKAHLCLGVIKFFEYHTGLVGPALERDPVTRLPKE